MISVSVILISCSQSKYAGKSIQSHQDNSEIDIEITTHLGDRQTYVEGDTVNFLVSLSHEAYVLLIYEDASGLATQILPNTSAPDFRMQAGIYKRIPQKNSSYEFTIAPPFGTEFLWAYAAHDPFPELQGTRLENGLLRLAHKIVQIEASLNRYFEGKKQYLSRALIKIKTRQKVPH